MDIESGELVSCERVHTLIIGSGAAGLNAAVQLKRSGIHDLLIVTEGLEMGTSINTGSDKQTYYKLSLCGDQADSPYAMAKTYVHGGSVQGDLALAEAAGSTRAFMHLVELGVPFPHDRFGQYVGYKTDHDPLQRATSIGPFTSREMCRRLISRVAEMGVPVREGRVAVRLLTTEAPSGKRCCGALAVNQEGALEAFAAENVVLAVGGPGGLYAASAYPRVHTGAIGLALLIGARARNLPDSQFGIASLAHPWVVSGSYMQVVPRIVSTDRQGRDVREFLLPYWDSPAALYTQTFLKGYQWPCDATRVIGESSFIDVLVHRETAMRERRVWLDYTENGEGFSLDLLADEARLYLQQSGANGARPIDRLRQINPAAISQYAEHGIDLATEWLEVAVCAQHNNGGLAGDVWWESENIGHLFPIGEVNGSHGVHRPGGAALNAGQVAGYRVAGRIAHQYAGWTLDERLAESAAHTAAREAEAWLRRGAKAQQTWQETRLELRRRMTRFGAHVRSQAQMAEAVAQAWAQYQRLEAEGCAHVGTNEVAEALRNRQLCFAHAVYLEAILASLDTGVGSRGSALVLDGAGRPLHALLGEAWRLAPEDVCFRERVLVTQADGPGQVHSEWHNARPLPETELWFETIWPQFESGQVFA